MKRQIRVAGLVLAVGLAAGTALNAQMGADNGQDDDHGPAMAMGSGRMVRGTVSAVTGDHLTLKTENGDTYTIAITPNTRLMKGRNPAKLADIKPGDGMGAMGEVDQSNKTVHALFVSVVDAEDVRKMKESLGKTWIAGKVTAIDETKLTILRSDKISQTILVDEDTSFKRGNRGMQMAMTGEAAPRGDRPQGGNGGGESITLADIKIGDNVAGQGALKNGTFVPTQLMVADPSQRRHRQQGDASAAPAAEPK